MKRFFAYLYSLLASLFGRGKSEEKQEPAHVQARALHKISKKSWDESQHQINGHVLALEEAFTDVFGNVYYLPANGEILNYSIERRVAIELYSVKTFSGLDDDYLEYFFKRRDELAAQKRYAEIYALTVDLEQRKNILPIEEKLLHLACLYFFRHDENPYMHDDIMQYEKLQAAKQDRALRRFFLQNAFQIWDALQKQTPAYQSASIPLSADDFERYLLGMIPTRTTPKTSTSDTPKASTSTR
jgi:hypothetical protein